MEHPPAIVDKAQRLAQLLLRVAAGEPLDAVNTELGFDLDEEGLARQQAKYAASERTWEALIDGRHGHPRKAHSALREWLYARKQEDAGLRASQLVKEIQEKFGVELTDGHVNYLLRKRALTAPPGRPFKRSSELGAGKRPAAAEAAEETTPAEAPGELIDNAGLFFPGGSKGRDGGDGGGRRDGVGSSG